MFTLPYLCWNFCNKLWFSWIEKYNKIKTKYKYIYFSCNSCHCYLYSNKKNNICSATCNRASDISRKKKQNFAGFSGANSRKNRPISRDFRRKTVKIHWKIGRFLFFFTGKKSKFAEKSADFAEFSRKKVKFRRICRGKFLEKSADFMGNFVGKLRHETISKKQLISLDFFGEISLKSINFASMWPALFNVFFNRDNHLLFQQQFAREMSGC